MYITPFTGPYIRLNVLGKEKEEYSEGNLSVTNKYNYFDEDDMGEDGTWNRCQVGWQIGANFGYRNLVAGIGYGFDFNEIAEKTKCGIFSVRVGVNF